MASEKPIIIRYNKEKHKGRDKYVAYCGICGNPIDKYTSTRFCRFCGIKQDWNDTPYYTRYALTEKAINWCYSKI